MEVQAAQNIAQVFLGIRLKCATCHDSFTDLWKQADTWGLASVYSERPLEMFRAEHAIGQFAPPKFLFPELGEIHPDATRRDRQAQLAALVTSMENGQYAGMPRACTVDPYVAS